MFNKKNKTKASNILFKGKNKQVKIGLALGGGGARGFAHVGAIKAFEEYGIKFDYVCGTSAGSIVGAFYAAGYDYQQMFRVCKEMDVGDIRTSKFILVPSKSDGIEKVFKNELGDINIQDLKIPFSAVAVDLISMQECVITKGNLAKACAGSCAVPGIFQPVVFGDRHLCDGGLQNTMPSDVPKLMGCDYVVAVDVNKSRNYGTESTKLMDVLGCTIRILMKGNVVKGYLYGDVVVKPETKRFKSTKKEGYMDMIEEGYKAAIDAMPEILKLFKRKPLKAKQKMVYISDDRIIM
ncbi:MAG: patatin-like phospholipase family protein [Clostridiales bacterium]|nr:patatin-like phospholipase family protein [Clostridiales bacterium]